MVVGEALLLSDISFGYSLRTLKISLSESLRPVKMGSIIRLWDTVIKVNNLKFSG